MMSERFYIRFLKDFERSDQDGRQRPQNLTKSCSKSDNDAMMSESFYIRFLKDFERSDQDRTTYKIQCITN